MGIENTVEATRFVVSTFLANVGRFFGTPSSEDPDKPAGEDDAKLGVDEIAINATICMLVGITLQDAFVSRIAPSDSNWFDRGVDQAVFWVTIYFIVRGVLAILRATEAASASLRAVFVTIPIAFLFGAYASSIGFFLKFVLEKMGWGPFQIMPHLAHMFVQLSIILLFFARELRADSDMPKWKSRVTMFLVFLFVLVVDAAIVWSSYWGA